MTDKTPAEHVEGEPVSLTPSYPGQLSVRDRDELINGLQDTAKFLASKGHTNSIYCVRAARALAASAPPNPDSTAEQHSEALCKLREKYDFNPPTLAALTYAIERLSAPEPAPIPMVLHCPACGLQHIDVADTHDEAADKMLATPRIEPWNNPPHRSHLCNGCGHIWRPADVPTEGVAAIQTRGKADSPIVHRAASPEPVAASRDEMNDADLDALSAWFKSSCLAGVRFEYDDRSDQTGEFRTTEARLFANGELWCDLLTGEGTWAQDEIDAVCDLISRAPNLLAEVRSYRAKLPSVQAGGAVASAECPVCGLDTPHRHSPPPLRKPFAEKLASTEEQNRQLRERAAHLEGLLKTAQALPMAKSKAFLSTLGEWPAVAATKPEGEP